MNEVVWKAADDKLGVSSDGEFWLGMNDLKDGTYRYESDGIEVVDGMWQRDQPNAIDEHCVGYHHRLSQDRWYDIDCSDRRMSICVSRVEQTDSRETGDYFLFMLDYS